MNGRNAHGRGIAALVVIVIVATSIVSGDVTAHHTTLKREASAHAGVLQEGIGGVLAGPLNRRSG